MVSTGFGRGSGGGGGEDRIGEVGGLSSGGERPELGR